MERIGQLKPRDEVNMSRRTVPQNDAWQWGHEPTRRRTAELQGDGPLSWQRRLAGMIGSSGVG